MNPTAVSGAVPAGANRIAVSVIMRFIGITPSFSQSKLIGCLPAQTPVLAFESISVRGFLWRAKIWGVTAISATSLLSSETDDHRLREKECLSGIEGEADIAAVDPAPSRVTVDDEPANAGHHKRFRGVGVERLGNRFGCDVNATLPRPLRSRVPSHQRKFVARSRAKHSDYYSQTEGVWGAKARAGTLD
jgi:hypothetical protein